MPTFRAGDHHCLMITVDDAPDVEMDFGFVDYEEAAIHYVVEGVDAPIRSDRDTLVTAIIQGWDGMFDDVHADPLPTPHSDNDENEEE